MRNTFSPGALIFSITGTRKVEVGVIQYKLSRTAQNRNGSINSPQEEPEEKQLVVSEVESIGSPAHP